jgi:UDP-glucose:glycoprotein glucosyltransferase
VEFHLQPSEYLNVRHLFDTRPPPLMRCRCRLSVSTATISFIRSHLTRPGKWILLELLPTSQREHFSHELPPQVFFRDLPTDPIYTLGLDEPSSWLVRPREALYDLDNIQLGVLSDEESQRGVEVVYELDYLIVGGHARETGTNVPPRGVQLQLAASRGKQIDDTLVVENLGYLQFKATPGVYQLEIREGRGREVFQLESAGNEGWQSLTADKAGNEVTVTSFEGVTLYPRLARLPGQEYVDILETLEEEEPLGAVNKLVSRWVHFLQQLWKRMTSWFSVSSALKILHNVGSGGLTQRHAEINIFTVASGLLYEVRLDWICATMFSYFPEIRIDHDPECPA